MADRDFVYNRTAKGKARSTRWREKNRAERNAASRLGCSIPTVREIAKSGVDLDKVGRTR